MQPRHVLVRLQGGLGNQLFQVVHGIKQARELTGSIWIDPTLLARHHVARTPEVLNLDLTDLLNAEGVELETLANTWPTRALGSPRLRWFTTAIGIAVIDGYHQELEHGETLRDSGGLSLRHEPSHAARLWAERIRSDSEAIAVHWRRGDYVTSREARRKHGSLSQAYFRKALSLLPMVGDVFVFSDDPNWAYEHLVRATPRARLVSSEVTAPEGMWLLSLSKHIVISNSTFSWWPAICRSRVGMTIYPRPWFADSSQAPTIFPASWTALDRQ